MAKAKSSIESPRRPGATGAANLKTGNPGNKGGGRTPDEFKQMCRELASAESVRMNVLKILASPDIYPNLYVGALKWATEHGYGKPTETMKIDAPEGATLTQVWTFGSKTVGF